MKNKILVTIAALLFISVCSFAQRVNPTEQPIKVVDEFRQQMGNGLLKLKSNHLPLGKVSHAATRIDTLMVLNNSETDMKLTFDRVPKYITVKTSKETIKPQEKAGIIVTFNASQHVDGNGKQQWGPANNRINVIINDDKEGSKRNIIQMVRLLLKALLRTESLKAPTKGII